MEYFEDYDPQYDGQQQQQQKAAVDEYWPEEQPQSLDALGRKRKGKGRGKSGKGKGKDSSKGKGKGKGDAGKSGTAWVERRQCHNCKEYGHLQWDCKKPRRVAASLTDKAGSEVASVATVVSQVLCSLHERSDWTMSGDRRRSMESRIQTFNRIAMRAPRQAPTTTRQSLRDSGQP